MQIIKLHTAGSDYLLTRERVAEPTVFASHLLDRRTGVGADGLLLLSSAEEADATVRMFLADGREITPTATALIAACERFAERQGMHGLRVTASESNPVLCQFLQHNGFELQGLNRRALIHTPEEREKPLMRRACALYFYRETEKG